MAIELQSETILTLTEATKVLPPLNGRRPSISSLWRWCRKGVRGVHLEYVRIGRNLATSHEALSRFVNRLAEADAARETQTAAPLPEITKSAAAAARGRGRPRLNQSADEVLARAGI